MPNRVALFLWVLTGLPGLGQFKHPDISREADQGQTGEMAVDLVFEVFSLPFSQAADLQRRSFDDTQIYDTIIDRLRRGEATQDVFQVIASQSGKEATVRDGSAMCYPTEFEPPGGTYLDVPNLLAHEEMVSPPCPTAMTTRDLGWSCSLIPRVDLKRGLIEVKVGVVLQEFIKNDLWGISPCQHQIPRFSRESIETEVSMPSGQVAFVGTMGEKEQGGKRFTRFAFLRAGVSGRDGEGGGNPGWRMGLEIFSLPLGDAGEIRRSFKPEDRYQAVLRGLKRGEIRQDCLLCVVGLEGTPSRIKQGQIYTYPYEYIPPPGSLSRPRRPVWNASPIPRAIPPNLHLYGATDLGNAMAVSSTRHEDGRLRVGIGANEARLLKRNSFAEGLARLEMPEFGRQKIRMGLDLEPGKAAFLGTSNHSENPHEARWVFLTARNTNSSSE